MPKNQPNPFYKYTSMAAKMIAVILVFTFGGMKLDDYLQRDFRLFTMIGAILGSALAMYSVIKDLTR